MVIILSPAKTLDFESAPIVKIASSAAFTKQASTLVQALKNYSVEELSSLMNISDKLAVLNLLRLKQWMPNPPASLSRQAICAFKGEVYNGLHVADWHKTDFTFAQQHLRILSGLYGVLRPLDSISPYRLEMGTKLPNPKGNNLYEFWGNTISENLQEQLYASENKYLINLASNEYFKAIKSKMLDATIISPEFKDNKNGQYKMITVFAKKARGMMARYIVQNKITHAEDIKNFSEGGYYYNDRLSKGNQWVFTRD